MSSPQTNSSQAALIKRMRDESDVDPRSPIAMSQPFRIESGPTPEIYFSKKHARGEVGKYYPLHRMSR